MGMISGVGAQPFDFGDVSESGKIDGEAAKEVRFTKLGWVGSCQP